MHTSRERERECGKNTIVRTLDLQFRTIDNTGTDQLNERERREKEREKNLFIPNVFPHLAALSMRTREPSLSRFVAVVHSFSLSHPLFLSLLRRVIDVSPTAGFKNTFILSTKSENITRRVKENPLGLGMIANFQLFLPIILYMHKIMCVCVCIL